MEMSAWRRDWPGLTVQRAACSVQRLAARVASQDSVTKRGSLDSFEEELRSDRLGAACSLQSAKRFPRT